MTFHIHKQKHNQWLVIDELHSVRGMYSTRADARAEIKRLQELGDQDPYYQNRSHPWTPGRPAPRGGTAADTEVWLQENDFYNSGYFAEIMGRDD